MNGTKFKVLMHMGMYVDTRLLDTGIYGCSKPNIYFYNDTIESLVKRTIQVESIASPEFIYQAYVDNLKQCELVPVVIMEEGALDSRIAEIRQALADYIYSEGCSCCEDTEPHEAAGLKLAELLGVKIYMKGRDIDWESHRTKD